MYCRATWQHGASGTDKAHLIALGCSCCRTKRCRSRAPAIPDIRLCLNAEHQILSRRKGGGSRGAGILTLEDVLVARYLAQPCAAHTHLQFKHRPNRQVPCSSLSGPAPSSVAVIRQLLWAVEADCSCSRLAMLGRQMNGAEQPWLMTMSSMCGSICGIATKMRPRSHSNIEWLMAGARNTAHSAD